MPVKKWVTQYLAMFLVLAGIFSLVQYLKGHQLEGSIYFGITWSVVGSSIFLLNRIYYFRKNTHCSVCNDLPKSENIHEKGI